MQSSGSTVAVYGLDGGHLPDAIHPRLAVTRVISRPAMRLGISPVTPAATVSGGMEGVATATGGGIQHDEGSFRCPSPRCL